MRGPRSPTDNSRGGCCHGGTTTTKQREWPVVSHEKTRTKIPATPLASTAVNVQLWPGRAKLDSGRSSSDAPQLSGPCCTLIIAVLYSLSTLFLFFSQEDVPQASGMQRYLPKSRIRTSPGWSHLIHSSAPASEQASPL